MNEINEKIFQFLNSKNNQIVDQLMLIISNQLSLFLISIIVCVIAYRYYRSSEFYHPVLNTIYFVIISHLLCLIPLLLLINTFPLLYKITPPCLNPNLATNIHLVGTECIDDISPFPFRTFFVTYFASFLYFTFKGKYKTIIVLFIIWALIVSYSRVYLGIHYPLYLIISAAFAVITGYFSSKSFYKLKDIL